MYGVPFSTGTNREGLPEATWTDAIYSEHISLIDDPKGCTVSVGNYSVGMTNILSSYLHEHGHVLLEDENQIDLSVGKDTHDSAGFIEGSFRKAFYDPFWKDLGVSAVGL